ncbi:nuclear transport factor 2 family protein [Amycolatopsis viridis]|uniref:SnoaL-like domain-containing protein n=1 Tax=Amycolatopsis viridis TaxID=185678 RepID=A0ABX0SUJ3_9PSEU|nr:nuclear transport factor 2 family protein [Amycolatopsis viridis]NIH80636.1 hypothetical protein [Amycolatopsis viridis]
MSASLDARAVTGLFHAYADALDRRDWSALDGVFLEDVHADYNGTEVVQGRAALVGMIRGYLDGCGPTQHLMGNERVVVEGDRATASVKMRVHHIGAAERAELVYECFGWYHAELVRTGQGWRVASWRQEVTHQLGTYDVFARA